MGADSLREFLILGEGFNTQVVTPWCFSIVVREILTLGEGFNTQVVTLLGSLHGISIHILHKWRVLTGEVWRPMRCGETIQYGTGLQC